jgi:class 3 adenylate cyclase
MAGSGSSPHKFSEHKRVLLVVDLAGSTRLVARFEAVRLAELIDAFMAACGRVIAAHNGRVIKALGDGCLAVFDEDAAPAAVATALELREAATEALRPFGIDAEIGVNIHQAVVAEGNFAPDNYYDVTGTGVFHLFRMGAGPGIRISEPVYRQLGSNERSPWKKQRPPATYTFEPAERS